MPFCNSPESAFKNFIQYGSKIELADFRKIWEQCQIVTPTNSKSVTLSDLLIDLFDATELATKKLDSAKQVCVPIITELLKYLNREVLDSLRHTLAYRNLHYCKYDLLLPHIDDLKAVTDHLVTFHRCDFQTYIDIIDEEICLYLNKHKKDNDKNWQPIYSQLNLGKSIKREISTKFGNYDDLWYHYGSKIPSKELFKTMMYGFQAHKTNPSTYLPINIHKLYIDTRFGKSVKERGYEVLCNVIDSLSGIILLYARDIMFSDPQMLGTQASEDYSNRWSNAGNHKESVRRSFHDFCNSERTRMKIKLTEYACDFYTFLDIVDKAYFHYGFMRA